MCNLRAFAMTLIPFVSRPLVHRIAPPSNLFSFSSTHLPLFPCLFNKRNAFERTNLQLKSIFFQKVYMPEIIAFQVFKSPLRTFKYSSWLLVSKGTKSLLCRLRNFQIAVWRDTRQFSQLKVSKGANIVLELIRDEFKFKTVKRVDPMFTSAG